MLRSVLRGLGRSKGTCLWHMRNSWRNIAVSRKARCGGEGQKASGIWKIHVTIMEEALALLSRSYREADFGFSKRMPRVLEWWNGLPWGWDMNGDKGLTGGSSLDSLSLPDGWPQVVFTYLFILACKYQIKEHHHCLFPCVTFAYTNVQTFPRRVSIWRQSCVVPNIKMTSQSSVSETVKYHYNKGAPINPWQISVGGLLRVIQRTLKFKKQKS